MGASASMIAFPGAGHAWDYDVRAEKLYDVMSRDAIVQKSAVLERFFYCLTPQLGNANAAGVLV